MSPPPMANFEAGILPEIENKINIKWRVVPLV